MLGAEHYGAESSDDLGKLVHFYGADNPNSRTLVDVYLFEYDGDIDLSRATTSEVAQSRWMTYDEIVALRDEGKLVWTLDYFFEGKVIG